MPGDDIMTIAFADRLHRISGPAFSSPRVLATPLVKTSDALAAEISSDNAAGLQGQWAVTANEDLISRNVTAAIGDLLDTSTIERALIAHALDAFRCAVLLTDAEGTILHVNRAAGEMLREGLVIREVGGTLKAMSRAAASALRNAIRLAAKDEIELGRTGPAVRLTAADAPPLFANVLPLAGNSATIAAIFIALPPDHHHSAAVVAAAFGLTPAETRVLASLLTGLTVAETARDLGVVKATARSHLDHIFEKTGVTRQAELFRLAAQLVPPIAPSAGTRTGVSRGVGGRPRSIISVGGRPARQASSRSPEATNHGFS
jgi:DNA-binding CsgD family transcriptional regulator/PAS domain-containing protein